MIDCKYKKQAGKAQEILEKLENTEIKSSIYYLSNIFKTMNMLNFELQGTNIKLVTCNQQIKGYLEKLKYWKKQFKRTVDI